MVSFVQNYCNHLKKKYSLKVSYFFHQHIIIVFRLYTATQTAFHILSSSQLPSRMQL